MRLLFIFFFVISFVDLQSQSVFKKYFTDPEILGDKLFTEFAYADAVEAYHRAHLKNASSDSLVLKIAEGYRMLNDPKNASVWYEKALADKPAVSSKYYLHYAEALSSEKRYAEAKNWYDAYGRLTADDGRVNKKITTINDQDDLFRNVSFVTIDQVDFNTPGSDFSPAFFGSEIVFVTSRADDDPIATTFLWDNSQYLELYKADENDVVSSFDKKINSKYHEGPLVFYDDNTKMIFTRNNYHKGRIRADKEGITKLKLYGAEYNEEESSWQNIQPLPFNNDHYSVGHPAISKDGSTLYFASDMPGGLGGTDIYRVDRQESGWSEPENLGSNINTEGNELFPFLHNDSDLYFASNGHGGLGGLDIFGISLTDGPDSQISNVGAPINSELDDFGIILRPDGKTGFFSTNREESLSNDDIYSFSTTRSLIVSYVVKGKVYDKNENNILAGIPLIILKDGIAIDKAITDESGNYSFLAKPNNKYELKTDSTEGYLPLSEKITTLEEPGKYSWEKDLYLTKDLDFELLVAVKEKGSGESIDGAHVVVIDNLTGKTIVDRTSDDKGELLYTMMDKELNDRISYQVQLSKEGYLGKVETCNGILDTPGRLDISKYLDLALDKIEVGTDLGKLVDIKPIYFDLGKYSIRPDAAAELDKIIAIMIENPQIEIELGSHTDSRGSASSNARLSDKRAKASADYIVSKGIEKSRIVGKGYGESVLINLCSDGVKCSEEEHQLNRRTEFRVTKVN